MRRHDKEITDQELINEILERSEICRLGFTDGKEAYIVPVNYAFSNGVIYIHSAPAGRKIDLIRMNNHVSFEIEDTYEIIKSPIACNWSAKYRSVMGTGRIEILDDTRSKITGLNFIMLKHGATGEQKYDEKVLDKMVILKMTIETVTGKQSGLF